VVTSPIVEVSVAEVPIRLGQFLKLAGLAGDGGEARALIEAGEVTVNGRAEERRGAQLRGGDVVAVGEQRARVRAAPDQPDEPDDPDQPD
jgi:ribosome-associated protein